MSKGLSLGKIFGVEIDLHWSTLLIVFIIGQGLVKEYIPRMHPGCSLATSLFMSLIMAVLFIVSIIAHEVAHARVGQMFGINFTGITIFVLGGMAKMDTRIPSAKAEFWMALAGPACSLVIGIVGILLAFAWPHSYLATVAWYIGIVNVMLALFNGLILAFPLDGGRILRAIVWGITKNYRISTLWCANIGRLFAVVFFVAGSCMILGREIPMFGAGISGGIWMFVIAFFIFAAATSEINAVNKNIE